MPSPNRNQDLRESQIVKALELALAALFVACAVLVMGVSPALKLAILVLLTALPSWVPLPAFLRPLMVIHEGLHLVAAHWSGVPQTQIGASGIHTYIGKVSKAIWIKVILFPLLFPLLILVITWILADFRLAIGAAFLTSLGSCRDLAYLVITLFRPSPYVIDDETGIFLTEAI
ncbi:MAG: hypothetical protein AUK02_02190 [Anaerolineae bacterium CG2_30_58_95]|nr:MAG: hypothetical protein AUK02_02190 [Anaerolineae bacterium CG2_30_58_95]